MPTLISPTVIDTTQEFSFSNVVADVVDVSVGIVANGTLGNAGQVLTSNGTTSYWAPAAGGGVANFTAANTITAGRVVVLNSNGTVQEVSNSTVVTTNSVVGSDTSGVVSSGDVTLSGGTIGVSTAKLGADRLMIAFGTTGGNLTLMTYDAGPYPHTVRARSNTTIVASDQYLQRANDNTAFLVQTGVNNMIAVAGSNSSSISIGATVALDMTGISRASVPYDSARDQYVVFGCTAITVLRTQPVTLTGTTITKVSSSPSVVDVDATYNNWSRIISAQYIPSTDVVAFVIGASFLKTGVLSWNGSAYVPSTITNTGIAANGGWVSTAWDSSTNTFLIAAVNRAASSTIRVYPATVNTSGISVNTAAAQIARTTTNPGVVGAGRVASGIFNVVYSDDATKTWYTRNFTANSSVVSLGNEVTVVGYANTYWPGGDFGSAVYAPDIGTTSRHMTLISKANNASTLNATTQTLGTSTSNYGNWIGVAAASATAPQTVPVTIMGGVNDKQAALTPGSVYYVQTNGALTTTSTSYKAGKALSANDILITVGNA